LLEGIDYVFHLAAQPGVRTSWGSNFSLYNEYNILATQRLLEAASKRNITKFIYASSSSVYGDTPGLPMREDSPLCPVSPYGVTKLAAEHLCKLYYRNFGVPVVILRYFTVYGPRQRPDMAIYRFITAIRDGKSVIIYGDGEQTRDFTFVSDAVEGTVLAMKSNVLGVAFNIGGGARVTVNHTLRLLEKLVGRKATLEYHDAQPGDVRHTLSDTSAIQQRLGFMPRISLEAGLKAEVAWLIGQT
jgi:UDP-glucose 4-epimerase